MSYSPYQVKWDLYRIDFSDATTYIGITALSLSERLKKHRRYSTSVNSDVFRRLYEGMPHDMYIVTEGLEYSKALADEFQLIKELKAQDVKVLNRNKIAHKAVGPLSPGSKRKKKRTRTRTYPPTDRDIRCSYCRNTKAATEFTRDRTRSTGRHSRCSSCLREIRKVHKADLLKRYPPDGKRKGMYLCRSCKELKPDTEFLKVQENRYGISLRCKACNICTVPSCTNQVRAKGLCIKHYMRARAERQKKAHADV